MYSHFNFIKVNMMKRYVLKLKNTMLYTLGLIGVWEIEALFNLKRYIALSGVKFRTTWVNASKLVFK